MFNFLDSSFLSSFKPWRYPSWIAPAGSSGHGGSAQQRLGSLTNDLVELCNTLCIRENGRGTQLPPDSEPNGLPSPHPASKAEDL